MISLPFARSIARLFAVSLGLGFVDSETAFNFKFFEDRHSTASTVEAPATSSINHPAPAFSKNTALWMGVMDGKRYVLARSYQKGSTFGGAVNQR